MLSTQYANEHTREKEIANFAGNYYKICIISFYFVIEVEKKKFLSDRERAKHYRELAKQDPDKYARVLEQNRAR